MNQLRHQLGTNQLPTNRVFVHSQFMDLSNPFEVVVHYLLNGGMISLSHWDGFSMMSTPVCTVTS